MSDELSINLPKGFRFAGTYCGIKKNRSAKDLSLIVCDEPAVGAGVYTQNQIVAAPVLNCRSKTPSTSVRAIVVNSGNANACTGERGAADAAAMCSLVAKSVGPKCDEKDVLVMSTGVIGHFLPMEKITQGIQAAADLVEHGVPGFLDAADGILTTDKARKIGSRLVQVGEESVAIAGMAKGAGMIGPNMATMLCCLLTDAVLEPEQAQNMLTRVANRSFNNISVEGHTSTNDTMLLVASGKAGSKLTAEQEADFEAELEALAIELAKQIPADGEGASHLIEVTVRGADSDADARVISHAVASSNLVKSAVFGNDPNWGRIVSAAGYAGPKIEVAEMELKLNGLLLYQVGEPVVFDASEANRSMRENATTVIELTVGAGAGSCTHWTSDLTLDYVRFNSEYTT